jgi:hypothetical protein
MTGHEHLDPEKREEAILACKDYLRGGGLRKSIVEEQGDLECTKLRAEIAPLLESTKVQDQTSLHFRLALYRSLRYSTASSYYCRSLYHANEMRRLYEGQRLLLMHPQS